MSDTTNTPARPFVITWPKDEYLSEADDALYAAYAAYRVDAEASGARRVFLTFESWLINREGA